MSCFVCESTSLGSLKSMACSTYTIDMCAAEFGMCTCGHPKSAHAQAPLVKKHKKKHKSKKFKMGGAPKASKEKSAAAPELPADGAAPAAATVAAASPPKKKKKKTASVVRADDAAARAAATSTTAEAEATSGALAAAVEAEANAAAEAATQPEAAEAAEAAATSTPSEKKKKKKKKRSHSSHGHGKLAGAGLLLGIDPTKIGRAPQARKSGPTDPAVAAVLEHATESGGARGAVHHHGDAHRSRGGGFAAALAKKGIATPSPKKSAASTARKQDRVKRMSALLAVHGLDHDDLDVLRELLGGSAAAAVPDSTAEAAAAEEAADAVAAEEAAAAE